MTGGDLIAQARLMRGILRPEYLAGRGSCRGQGAPTMPGIPVLSGQAEPPMGVEGEARSAAKRSGTKVRSYPPLV